MNNNIIVEPMNPSLQYLLEARSDIGGRSEQQDCAYACVDENQLFAVLCDGMGGTEDGAAASTTAVAVMRGRYLDYRRRNQGLSSSWFLYDAMVAADDTVARMCPNGSGGATMVAVMLTGSQICWLSVGDSRLYIMRSDELVQATRDHNYFLRLNELLAKGAISEEIYEQEVSRGEALISYVGMDGVTLFDLTRTEMLTQPGDILLLSTDGLFRVLPPEVLRQELSSDDGLATKADKLMQLLDVYAAKEIQDNTTFILIQVV